MSILSILGDLDLKLSVPGELIVNGKPVGSNISIAYAGDQLRLVLTPIGPDGTEGNPISLINRITYNRGVIGLMGVEAINSINYTANYSILAKRLSVSITGITSEHRVQSVAEAIGIITKIITAGVTRFKASHNSTILPRK